MLKRSFAATVVAVVLLSSALAEETPPPPEKASARDDAPQVRKQRRRRIVSGLLDRIPRATGTPDAKSDDASQQGNAREPSLLDGLLPLLAPEARGPNGRPNTAPLEPGKLNDVVEEELTGPLVEELDDVEALRLRFNESQTDFARDRIGLDFAIQLRSTPWGNPAELVLHLFARLEQSPGQAVRAAITCDVDLQTDTVSLCEFLRQKALDAYRRHLASGTGDDEVAEMCRLLESVPPMTTLTDVSDFLPLMGEVNLRSVNRKVEAIKAEIDRVQDPAAAQQLQGQLAKAYSTRDKLLAANIRSHRDSELNVHEIYVTLSPGGVAQEIASVDLADLQMTAGSIHGKVEASVGQTGVVVYQGAKALVIEPALRRLQARDGPLLKSLRERARDLNSRLDELQGGPREAEALPPPGPAIEKD